MVWGGQHLSCLIHAGASLRSKQSDRPEVLFHILVSRPAKYVFTPKQTHVNKAQCRTVYKHAIIFV